MLVKIAQLPTLKMGNRTFFVLTQDQLERPVARVENASPAQKQILAKEEEKDKVVHVSRPAGFTPRMKSPVRILEQ